VLIMVTRCRLRPGFCGVFELTRQNTNLSIQHIFSQTLVIELQENLYKWRVDDKNRTRKEQVFSGRNRRRARRGPWRWRRHCPPASAPGPS
jgi:hypothetical protein